MVAVTGNGEEDGAHFAMLRTAAGKLRKLIFLNPIPEMEMPHSGAQVVVEATFPERCGLMAPRGTPINDLCVESLLMDEAAPLIQWAAGQPRGNINLKVIAFFLDICSSGPASDPQSLSQVLFSDVPGAQNETLEGLFTGCSYGKGSLSATQGSKVHDVTIPIPCSGTTPSGTFYDSQQCPFPEWSDVALDFAKNRLGIDLSQYTNKIFVLPSVNSCQWSGMGYVGCKDDCRVWINGNVWDKPVAYFHELGHNMFLNHAGQSGDNGYKDLSGAMGYCCRLRCYNTPHAYQLGWAGPLGTLYKDNLPAGTWRKYTLPPAIESSRNFLLVKPNWNADAASYSLFVSYRKKEWYDIGLDATRNYGDRVIIYSTTSSSLTAQAYSSYEGAAGNNGTFFETRLGSGLVVWVKNLQSSFADVHVCRRTETQESNCWDGLDTDCDGLVDADDPDCQQQQKASVKVS